MSALDEPVLSVEDVRIWERWRMAFLLHSRTRAYRGAVDHARRIASQAIDGATSPMACWSGGKDSTGLALLLRELGGRVLLVSEKDDLDYPGEEDYVRGLAAAWGANLEIVRPPVSPMAWLLERRGRLSAGEEMHARSAELSKACFYGVMERANAGHDVILWGLRADESGRRRALLTKKGASYALKNGVRRAAPLAFWTGQDVFAFLQERGVEPLHVYRCCGFLEEHRLRPWLIRKSWWIPGRHAANGSAAWLRRYWPSLFAKLSEITYDAKAYT
jgi:3'-phosphoadenosine 5'-phosphosulfate sulfotransferase (PAPS reductase)/FAD synthetase